MPGTEIVRKQTVLGGAAGIALLAFALIYRFYPGPGYVAPQEGLPNASPPSSLPAPPSLTVQPAPPSVQNPPWTPPEARLPVPAPEPSTPVASTEPATPPTKAIAALLKKADAAFAEGHLTEPKESSALAYYSQVLEADKDNAEASAGIDKIHKSLFDQGGAALDRGDEREATRLIGELRELPHAGEDLAALEAREKTLKEVMPLLSHAAQLLREGRATSPPPDNALAVYREVMKLDPGNKLADQGLAQIERDYLDRALAAAAQDDFAGADQILADGSNIRPGSHELQDTRARIEGIRRQRATNTLSQANSALDAGNADLADLLAQKALGLSPDVPGIEEFNRRLRNARLYASFSPGQIVTDKFLDRNGSAPALVVIPTGHFTMGSPPDEPGHRPSEEPQRDVRIDTGFALGRDEVTVGEFRAFVMDAGYVSDAEKLGASATYEEDSGRISDHRGVTWRDDYRGIRAADDLPVVHVSWNDAMAYVQWLSARTGKKYRLPSEAEFEYALRAGSAARYPWGDGDPTKVYENVTGDGDRSPRLKRSWAKAFPHYDDHAWGPAPVGSYPADAFGLHDMDGNVSEWVADCWHDNYTRAPTGSGAWVNPGCTAHVVRGGSWGSAPEQVRSAYRIAAPTDTRNARVGMRVARDL
ncbi:MAG TPA: SUMF1/EgtB/PvdO family nonheme iron enzyme [Rudaea sp.]|nr:SUMF1/EgtB/PvdO family nonheme iron enzyme [Rudaea sp.]